MIKLKRKNEVVVKKQKLQTIPVRDLKEYLVKDFELIKKQDIEIDKLKDRIEELELIEVKYNATLITLEEYDSRVEREKVKVYNLEVKLDTKSEEIKVLNEKVNNAIIKEKQAEHLKNNVKDEVIKDYKKQLISVIENQKGNLSKKRIYDLIKGTK